VAQELPDCVVHFYTTDKAKKLTGSTLRQLQYWREKKIVVPAIDEAGRGRTVYYSYENLVELMVLRYLLGLDLTFKRARKTLEAMRGQGAGSLAEAGASRFLLTMLAGASSLSVEKWTEGNEAAGMAGKRLVVFINLEEIEKTLRSKMDECGIEAPEVIFPPHVGG
jgi:DNA-binding transcriptional MerR regulator